MIPWEASPKNDILLGWFNGDDGKRKGITGPYDNYENIVRCIDSNADIQMAVNQLTSAAFYLPREIRKSLYDPCKIFAIAIAIAPQ